MTPDRHRSNSFDPSRSMRKSSVNSEKKPAKRLSAETIPGTGSNKSSKQQLKVGNGRLNSESALVKSKTSASMASNKRPQRNSAELKKKSAANQRRKLEKKQDQKAAKTLSAILLAFILTWTPYNINVVANTFCDNCLDQFEMYTSFGKFTNSFMFAFPILVFQNTGRIRINLKIKRFFYCK